ncbi:MAG: hypothetical protein J7L03_01350 [Caldisericaceae bacterium]|nr:hypothetical protein [Caldisericaceae bacterium]
MRLDRIILNSARIIGLAAGFLWTFVLLFGTLSSGGVYNQQLTFLFLLIVANFASVIVALWEEKIGGILLILFSAILCVFALMIAGHNKIIAVSVSGLPFLLSGVLFVVYSGHKKSKKLRNSKGV